MNKSTELFAVFVIWAVILVLFLGENLIPALDFLDYSYFLSANLIAIASMLTVSILILAPALMTYSWEKKFNEYRKNLKACK